MTDLNNRRPRILVVTSTYPRWENDPGPAFVFELSRRLTASFEITVLAPRSPGSKSQEYMAGLNVIRFSYFFKHLEKLATHSGGILSRLRANPFYFLLVPFFLIGQLLALIHLLRRRQFDLIHAHWLIPQGLSVVIVQTLIQRSIPLLCTSHGGDLFALRGRMFHCLKRSVIKRSRALTVVSQVMKKIVVEMGVSTDKVHVIPMGVDLAQRFTPDSTVRRRGDELLFVGRLVEKKGLRVLLEAMPTVLSEHPATILTVAGTGPLERALRKMARQLNISHKVNFLGMVAQSELPALYRRATIAVFPFVVAKSGDQEGFGLVQVEAMGCECPVIASDLPAIHDIIEDGKNGKLVPSGNSQALSRTIDKLLFDHELRKKLAREGRKSVLRQFDWKMIIEGYSRLYCRLTLDK